MAKKGGLMHELPTQCRFAVLEVSDDSEDDENKSTLVNKKNVKTTTTKTDNSSASSKKKKQRKRRNKNKNAQSNDFEEEPSQNSQQSNTKHPEESWESWQERDEQYVLQQFQKDLKAALEASKTMNLSKKYTDTDLMSTKKKKKDKTVSLDEFISGNSTQKDNKHKPETNGSISAFPDDKFQYGLDEFQYQDNLPVNISAPEEKPQKTKKKKKTIETSTEEETLKKEQQEHKEHKLPATHEESIKAEMVHIQEELSEKDDLIAKQQQTIEKQKGWISELQKELIQVKKRNKQLCHILGQGEMKEKSDLLLQIEELNEVRDQVVQLHAELEQERSKSSALKQEIAKHQVTHGRTRHGSTS